MKKGNRGGVCGICKHEYGLVHRDMDCRTVTKDNKRKEIHSGEELCVGCCQMRSIVQSRWVTFVMSGG